MLERRGFMKPGIDPDRTLRLISHWARGLLGILVPPLCVACGNRLEWDAKWLCRGCTAALALEAGCRRREITTADGRAVVVRSAFGYTPVISAIIAEMKYSDKPGLAGMLAPFLGMAVGDRAGSETGFVPVPIHASKRRERGYNQSRLLALALSGSRGLRLFDVLVKTRATVSQTGLERGRRLSNVTGSIDLKPFAPLLPEKAVLVDDVVTTGATLGECAGALDRAGVKEIAACTIAASS
jgi:ComF family protein